MPSGIAQVLNYQARLQALRGTVRVFPQLTKESSTQALVRKGRPEGSGKLGENHLRPGNTDFVSTPASRLAFFQNGAALKSLSSKP